MKTLNWNTKLAQSFINAYEKSNITELSQCYGRHSTRKEYAYRECRKQCGRENGWGFKIISYNTFHFSCAWLVSNQVGDEFLGTNLRIETPCNSYVIESFLPF